MSHDAPRTPSLVFPRPTVSVSNFSRSRNTTRAEGRILLAIENLLRNRESRSALDPWVPLSTTCNLPGIHKKQPWPADRENGSGEKKGVLCEIRALLMVIGPPYDCWVTFNDRADLIVSYCIRRPTTPTGTFEARVFQTIPIFFLSHCFFSLPKNALSLKIMLEMFPWIGSRGILSWGDINVVEVCLAIFFYFFFFGRGLSWKFVRGKH